MKQTSVLVGLSSMALTLSLSSFIVRGGGPGLSVSVINLDHDSLAGGSNVHGSTSDAVWAWQIYGGARYKLTDNMSLGFIYKYFEAGSPTWDVRRTSQDIRFGDAHTH